MKKDLLAEDWFLIGGIVLSVLVLLVAVYHSVTSHKLTVLRVIRFEGCEYVVRDSDLQKRDFQFIHKANCTNSFHQ